MNPITSHESPVNLQESKVNFEEQSDYCKLYEESAEDEVML